MSGRGSLKQRGSVAASPGTVAFPYINVYRNKVGFSTRLSRNGLTLAHATAAAQRMAAAGLTIAREDLAWASVESSVKGTYNWAVPDLLMTAFATAGIDWLPLVSTTPSWASGSGDVFAPPINDANFADFCIAVLGRYGAGGSFWSANPGVPAKPVSSIELWNEPFYGDPALVLGFFHASGANAPTWPAGGPDAIKYASMVVAAATAIRAAYPAVKIGICGEPYIASPTPLSTQFLNAVLVAQPTLVSSNLFDAVVIHPYPAGKAYSPWAGVAQGAGAVQLIDPAGRFDRVSVTKAALLTAGATNKEIWATEVGWTTLVTNDGVSESEQADYIRGALRRLVREFGLTRVYVFMYQDQGPTPVNETDYFNVLTTTGLGVPGTPKEAFTTIRKMVSSGDDGTEVYKTAVLADNPIAYFRLNGTGGVARDHSPTKLLGSQVGTVTRKQPSALVSDPTAASTAFDGVSGGFTVPHHNALNPTQAITLEAWALMVSPGVANSQIFRKTGQYRLFGGPSPGTGWVPSGVVTIGGVDHQVIVSQGDAIPYGVWAHVVSVYDGANLRTYINGRLVKYVAQTGLIDTSTNVAGIGYQGVANGQFWPGSLQEVAMYAYALSPQRISEHYQAGAAALAV